jgi:hypothetical protein
MHGMEFTMTRFLSLAFMVVLAGCGYSEDKYRTESIDAACNKFDECGMIDFFGGSVDACITQSTDAADTDTTECVDYDSAAAKDCVDALTAISCDDLTSGNTASMDVCNSVCSNTGGDTTDTDAATN